MDPATAIFIGTTLSTAMGLGGSGGPPFYEVQCGCTLHICSDCAELLKDFFSRKGLSSGLPDCLRPENPLLPVLWRSVSLNSDTRVMSWMETISGTD